jgi:hypothetical protein
MLRGMARPRSLPDSKVFAAIRALQLQGGDKAVSFGAVSRATGLAPSTLAQRYKSVAGMLAAAAGGVWAEAGERLDAALTESDGKGASGLLKALGTPPMPDRSEAAAIWRARVETALAIRIGGAKAAETAGMLFAAWAAQGHWPGEKSFRLKDMVKRLD